MGRLLDALKRLEPEISAEQSVAAPAKDTSASDSSVKETAVLEQPDDWPRGNASADDLFIKELESTPTNEATGEPQAVEEPSEVDRKTICMADLKLHTVQDAPYESVSVEIDGLARLLDEEIPSGEKLGETAGNESEITPIGRNHVASNSIEENSIEENSIATLEPTELDSSENAQEEYSEGDSDENATILFLKRPVKKSEHEGEIPSTAENSSESGINSVPAKSKLDYHVLFEESKIASEPFAVVNKPAIKEAQGVFGAMARNILAQLPEKNSSAILLTSPTDGEGKTETILPLAEAIVEASGRKTILVDANLHHPDLTQEWQITPRRGIFEVLAGEADWWEAVQETGLPNLSILANTGLRQNAVVARPLAFSELLETLKREYQLVLIDAASLAHVESVPMIRYCQGVYLIVRLGVSSRRVVKEASQIVVQAGGNLLGCIAVGDVLSPT
jgi:Mrp family chromosome partitioning ATPase